ncbi:MAG: PIG-L deacetylase family protein [Bryobacteraceae bacterium]
MTKHVLAIHAHPDDVEILAGGTVALLAKAGHRVTIVSMTPGDCGSAELDADEIASVRRAEAASAAGLIGAEYRCAEFRDLAIFPDDAARRRVVEVLRRVGPDIILTSSPIDYMADHEAASQLVRDSCFAAPARNYSTGAQNPAAVLASIPHLYFMDPIGGVDRDSVPIVPDFYIDITSTFDIKRNMLAEHKSQREWLRKHHGMDDYINQMQSWTRSQGQACGVGYAEGFRLYKGHPYPQSPLLEELLEGYVVRRRPAA